MNKIRPQKLKDIKYELHLLFSADLIISVIEKSDKETINDSQRYGNIVNLFKNSVYLHSRNLFNFLTKESLTEIGKVPALNSPIYLDWKNSIERYVTHLKQARDQKGQSNIIANGKHLKNQTHTFTDEIKRLIEDWIKKEPKRKNQIEIKELFKEAKKNANMDRDKFIYLMKTNK